MRRRARGVTRAVCWFEWDSFAEALTSGGRGGSDTGRCGLLPPPRLAILALAIAAARTGVRDDTPGHVRREVETMLRTETDKAQYLEVPSRAAGASAWRD